MIDEPVYWLQKKLQPFWHLTSLLLRFSVKHIYFLVLQSAEAKYNVFIDITEQEVKVILNILFMYCSCNDQIKYKGYNLATNSLFFLDKETRVTE